MDISVVIIVATILAALAIIRVWLNKIESKTASTELVEWLKDLGHRVEVTSQTVDQKLMKNMEMFASVQKSIGEFTEVGRTMQELQHLLQSPKIRGNIGEQILKDLLGQYLPHESYKLQYTFQNGDRVDAIIKTSQGIIPIDSKFPIENFRRMVEVDGATEKDRFRKDFEKDVKRHIEDIAKKYILTDEGTVDYALMYIPSEAVYYEIINSRDLCDIASLKKVVPTSPMMFYAYLKAILMSFEGQKIQSQTKEILTTLKSIKRDYEQADSALNVVNKHFTNAYNQLSQVSRIFLGLGQKLSSTHLLDGQKTTPKVVEEIPEKLVE